ncbi:Carboxylesterase [Streptomyces sp. YIM 121038]|uniref:carboxylesterase/lipase family protein n=1 Tax=Streptomyces sp. YIM 121038 TaxID=2136401 RepID=UPI001110C70F|nr:carboxylesterase family protein [Streptomyces sp. YIM 121038]QCX74141.1 Carboxylesterase [Streptomyces sp. YIM 121038]
MHHPHPDPVVTTAQGLVRGLRRGGTTAFLAIPYAAPPRGAARFAPPRPHAPWHGVRDATAPGPTAPQSARGLGGLDMSPYFGTGWSRGDDYLTVNVWAPAEGGDLPVMVFVHGRGFVAGSTRSALYDGSAFARDGVVLVTLNYRLGIAGFLDVPGAPANRGLLDVVAALRWVRENITAFGGDPRRVTLFGQSAGATLVGGVLAAPEAAGLFGRAIAQSGSGLGAFTPEQAARVTRAAAGALGIEPRADAFAAVPDDRLVPVDQYAPSTPKDVEDVAARSHPHPERLVETYRTSRPGASFGELRSALMGDALFGAGSRALAAATAAHAVELPFVFDLAHLPQLHGPTALLGPGRAPAALASRVHATWIRFAEAGDPGWDPYDDERRATMRIDTEWTLLDDPRGQEGRAWPRSGRARRRSASGCTPPGSPLA